MVSGFTWLRLAVSARVVVARAAGRVDVGGRVVTGRVTGLACAADDPVVDGAERAVDCRWGLGVEQAASPSSASPASRIFDITPPTAGRS